MKIRDNSIPSHRAENFKLARIALVVKALPIERVHTDGYTHLTSTSHDHGGPKAWQIKASATSHSKCAI